VSYHDQHPKDNFIPFVIEIFGCLHQHVDNFFSSICQHGMVSEGLWKTSFLILHSFYRQRMYVVLDRVHSATIVQCVVVIT